MIMHKRRGDHEHGPEVYTASLLFRANERSNEASIATVIVELIRYHQSTPIVF